MTTTATTPPALPPFEECTTILSTCLEISVSDGGTSNSLLESNTNNSIGTWRKLIQRVLSHGTNYDRLHELAQQGSSAQDESAKEAGNLLCHALEWYLTRYWHQQQERLNDNNDGRHEDDKMDTSDDTSESMNVLQSHLKDNPVICAVVESLWLVGCLLESSEDDTPSDVGSVEKKKKDPKQIAHDNLLAIIQLLVTPRPWLVDHDKSEKDEDDETKEVKGGAMEVDGVVKDSEAASKKNLQPLIPITCLQTTLELSLLEAANLLPTPPPTANKKPTVKKVGGKVVKAAAIPDTPKSLVNKKLKKMNTDMYYRQHKFNLLAEESEGYSKLLGFLVLGLKDEEDGAKEDGNNEGGRVKGFGNATKYVRELIGAFDLDPNRVLDLALDALEWELNELVTRAPKDNKSSFAELSKSSSDDGNWWGLETVRTAMSNCGDGGNGIHSLLAIIRELDGNNNNGNDGKGEYEGRAVAHLLGFKYRSYHCRSSNAVSVNAVKQGKGGVAGSDGKASSSTATASTATQNVYPRSLYLSTAFLCAHGILDPHALIPHLVANSNSTASASTTAVTKKSPGAAIAGNESKSESSTATSLMSSYQTYTTTTIKRLKKLGVVSLNSSNDKKKDDTQAKGVDQATATAANLGEAFKNDPTIGIFRALLALGGNWDASVAFLAHASISDFASLVTSGDEDKMRSSMNLAVLAACTLCEGVAVDACAWVNRMIDGVYRELYPSSKNVHVVKGKQGKRGGMSLMLPASTEGDDDATSYVLSKNSSLANMSAVLQAPLASLVKSGKIRLNQTLYIKLCRLYKHKLNSSLSSTSNNETSEVDPASVDCDTLFVLSTFLVPSLSLFPSDTTLPNELWAVLQNLPYTIRYKLYSSWRHPGLEKGTLRSMPLSVIKTGNIPKPLGIIESEIETGIAARYVLKRISKENITDMGKQLAKTSHNNPLVVFTDILSKIESYDNLILMMVDTFGFVTKLGLDVMGYCLLVSLGGGEEDEVGGGQRSRTKLGGLNTEQWLASLETFTGAFYKKFPDVELRGILVYLTKRFKEGQVSELGVLRSLIKTAGGYGFVDYDSTAALSGLQLDGRCGSRLLKRETSSFGVVDDINRKASQQLRSVLQGGDLGVIILILLSQIRSKVLYSKSSDTVKEHVKVIGNMYDDCEAVMCLLLEYLSDSSMDSNAKAKFAASMPSISDLHEKYGVDTAVAWMLCRPLVRKSMFYEDDSKLASKEEPPAYLKQFTASSEMTTSYQTLLPEAAWKHITPTMFEMFYSLAIYDITCPEERYNVDVDRLKKDCERLNQLQKGGEAARGQMSVLAAAAAAAGGNYEQIRQATAWNQTRAMELDRLKRNVDQLSKDFQRQQRRCKLVLSKLEAQKASLIGSDKEEDTNSAMFAPAFMTFCIYPRCFLSPEDSLFCAHYVKILHKINVPGFLTIELIDNIVNAVTGSLYCMTEDEAGNCSIFFNEIWKSVNCWRYDNDAFALELKDTPGSRLSKEFAKENGIEDHALTGGITHDDYKEIYKQWHKKIASASIGCLKSSEYMHTRAALIVLSRIVLVFPTQPKAGEKILKTLGPLQGDENARPDIRATAQGYCSQLMKARDEGMWKEENIVVTKARQEKEKMKAEERKKKLAQQHEDMKKESEMISKQLGDGRGDRRRDDRGRPGGMDPRMNSRGPPLSAGAPKFTPKSGGESRELQGHPGESRRPGMERDAWERDRGGRQSDSRDSRRPGGESGRGERRKRSRSPEPGEDTERQTQKRSRGERDWAPPHRSSSDQQQSSRGGGGPRHSDRRGGSSRY